MRVDCHGRDRGRGRAGARHPADTRRVAGRRPAAGRIWAAALDLVLPETCVGCGCPGSPLCGDCERPLLEIPAPAWPTPSPAGLPPPFAVAGYDGIPRAAILAYKEQRRLGLVHPLGRALAAAAASAWQDARRSGPGRRRMSPRAKGVGSAPGSPLLLLVPVPSTRAAVRARGHDAAARLARVAVRELRRAGVPAVRLPVLRHARVVRDQAGLSAESRAGNLAGALAVPRERRHLVAGRQVVLVDDIITTGATLAEAARSLRAAAADPIGAAVIAATGRHIPPQDLTLSAV